MRLPGAGPQPPGGKSECHPEADLALSLLPGRPDQWSSYLKTWQRRPAQVSREPSDATGDRLILGQAALESQVTAPGQHAQHPSPPSPPTGQEQLPGTGVSR